jgi:hypothetical protein
MVERDLGVESRHRLRNIVGGPDEIVLAIQVLRSDRRRSKCGLEVGDA